MTIDDALSNLTLLSSHQASFHTKQVIKLKQIDKISERLHLLTFYMENV